MALIHQVKSGEIRGRAYVRTQIRVFWGPGGPPQAPPGGGLGGPPGGLRIPDLSQTRDQEEQSREVGELYRKDQN